MRFADRLLRRHLSETVLTRAWIAGERPPHLDDCPDCASRADDLGHWLERMRSEANVAADQAFPPERLAIQQAQILRHMTQADHPVRVIEFPASRPVEPEFRSARRVAPAWLGVAAAAGLAVGVVGGHLAAPRETVPAGAAIDTATASPEAFPATEPDLMDYPVDLFDPRLDLAPTALRDLDEATPSIVPAQYALR